MSAAVASTQAMEDTSPSAWARRGERLQTAPERTHPLGPVKGVAQGAKAIM